MLPVAKKISYFAKIYVYNLVLVVFIQLTHTKSFVKSCFNLTRKKRNCSITHQDPCMVYLATFG